MKSVKVVENSRQVGALNRRPLTQSGMESAEFQKLDHADHDIEVV